MSDISYLMLAGRLHPDNRVQLRHSYVVTDRPSTTARRSELSAEVLDREGTVLGRWPVAMKAYSSGSGNIAIRGAVPLPAGAERVALWRDSGHGQPIRLTVVELPEASPEVSFEGSPSRSAEGRVLLRWRATGEPEPVEYRVHFSHDGRSWLPVSRRLVSSEMEIDLDRLPGGDECRFRVRATNGVRSGEAVSRAFRLAIKPCQALIQQPIDGTEVAGEVTLDGNGWWMEEGRAEVEALRWESDRDGPVGEGRGLVVTLTPGPHTITLRAGSGDRVGDATVQVTVVSPD